MKYYYNSLAFLILLFLGYGASAQTTLINPNTGGGFESGADFASNGWTVANGTITNKWFVGTVPTGFTNNVAYISSDAGGATWAFNNASVSVVHFYRDVTFPAGESDATLTFNWQALGETGFWDALMVSIAPTSFVPTATSTSLGQNPLAAPAITIAQLWNVGSVQTASVKIPASILNNCTASATYRLIFTWKNDGSGGSNPPAAVDNISLVSQNPSLTPGRITSAGGTFTINQALPNTGSNFTTFTEAINALNGAANFCQGFTNPVVFNVASNQLFNEALPAITASGTTANNIIFQKSGVGPNPVVMRTDGGILTTSTFGGQGDAIITIDGGDFITFSEIDVTSMDQGIEYGYFLRKASGTDGCKNVTIKNSTITMTRGTSVFVTGIYSSNLDANSAVSASTGVTVTSTGGRHENVIITGNTVTNVFTGIHLRGFAAATPFDFYDQNFVVGSAGAGNANTINNFGGTGTAASYGIYVQQHNAVTTNYNNINNLDNGGTNSTGTMYGIYFITGTNSSLTANFNNIHLTGISTSGSGILSGIFNSSFTGNLTIENNTISLQNTASSSGSHTFIHNGSATAATAVNIRNNNFAASQYTTTAQSNLISNSVTNAAVINIEGNKTTGPIVKDGNSSFFGYFNSSSPTGFENIFNNNFSDITVNGTSGFTGISVSAGGAALKRNIYGNVVSNIQAGGTTAIGILKGTGNSNIYRNKIFNLTANGATTSVFGIQITGSVKDSIYNNIIGDLFAPNSGSATNAISGIHSTANSATSTIGIYYNTIFLNATSGGTNFGTNGIFLTGNTNATTAAVDMRNNIIVNNSTPNGTGFAVVFRRSTTSLANLATTTNNNLLFTLSPGGNTALFYDGTNADYNLADFKTRVSPRASASISENPNFVSTTGSDPTYLHINTSIPTEIESGGTPITGITTDFDGDIRNTSTPDIGADEFNGLGIDLTPPAIVYAPLLAACSSGDRTLSNVNITDASGVPVTGSLVPRIYYRKAPAGSWFSKPGTLTSGTSKNGLWSFTIVAADMGTLNVGDAVEYFVIAQDIATSPNIGSNPGGATASNVNTVSGFPPAPNTYNIGLNLNGTYTVGIAGTFKTIAEAVNIYNSCPLAGPTVFSLIDPGYPENFPIVIGTNSAASITNTLTIRPAAGIAVNISGAPTDPLPSSIFKLDGADHIIINGVNSGGSSMMVENTSTVAGSAVIWLASTGINAGATHNVIKNLTIKGGIQQTGSVTTSTYGIVLAGSALNSGITSVVAGNNNNYNTIDSNRITTVRYGIYSRGGAATNLNVGNIITANIIGPDINDADRIGKGGIVIREEDSITISRNNIKNIGGLWSDVTSGTDRVGIAISTDASWTPTSVVVKNAQITRNLIHDIFDERTFSAVAISIASADGANITNNVVANNMIYNILANGTSGDQTIGIGISAGKGDKIVYNSIYLTGDTDPSTGSTTPSVSNFGISISSTAVTDISILNNNVFMDLSSSSAPALRNAAISIPASYVWGSGDMNYNNWYIAPGNTQSNIGAVGGSGGTFHATLPAWQTATSRGANSWSLDPLFIAPTDLHISNASPLDLKGTPVPGVTIDYDGQPRDASVPDIGADEINVNNCTGAVGGKIVATNPTICESDSTIITGTGFSTGSGSSYQWEASTNNINFTPVSGANSPASFNTRALTVTTYFRLRVSCTSGTAVAYSDTATVTVNVRPTLNVSPNGPVTLCEPATQQLTVTNTSASAPVYQWMRNGNAVGSNSANYTATTTGNYTVRVTESSTGCFRTSDVVVVTINDKPSEILITPPSATMCNTTDPAVLLTATGGTIPVDRLFGTQAAKNTLTTFPSPFSNYWGGNRHQFLVLASELSAAGFGAGSELSRINFAVDSIGTTFTNCQDFKVKMGHTTNNSLTAFAPGLATVFGPATINPVKGPINQIDFTAPFVWNGTENLIIETTYSNNNTGNTSDGIIMFNTPTAFQSTIVFRADGQTATAIEAGTTVNNSFSARPDFTLTGKAPTNMVWSPVTGLFTNAAATIPYTGASTNTVYAKPGATTTFTATSTSNAGCTSTQTVVITVSCPVPVTLLSFKGEKKGNINSLEWTTTTEINNAGFELQRSADGNNFSSLVFVPSKANGGNSTSNLSYNFNDIKPLFGNGYYRLKQIDKDGKFNYSNVVLIKGSKASMITLSSVYPNPTVKDLNLVISSPVTEKLSLVVTDLAGRVMLQKAVQSVSGDNLFNLQVSNLAAGTYFIKAVCANGCEAAVQKFVKQ